MRVASEATATFVDCKFQNNTTQRGYSEGSSGAGPVIGLLGDAAARFFRCDFNGVRQPASQSCIVSFDDGMEPFCPCLLDL